MFLNCKNRLVKIKHVVSNVRLFFLDLIFPIECLGCGRPPAPLGFGEARESGWLCEECFKKIKFKPKQYCLHCKKENDWGEFCAPPARLNDRSGGCQVLYGLNGVWIAALYDEDLISRAIKKLKYYFVKGLASDLAKLLIIFTDKLLEKGRILKPSLENGLSWRNLDQAKKLPAAILNFKGDLVMPVPLSRKRLRWRGFNQAEILAKIFSENYGLEINTRDLIRVKHKKAQAKLNEIHRQENIKNCFTWRGGNLKKRNIILIDDVVTTGATLNECAKVLKANGAGQVFGLVVAKG
jgi:ComF family protein